MRATAFALEESGWRSARVPRFHASPATGHRDEKNLITIPPGGGEGRKEIGGRDRPFAPAVAVSEGVEG